MTICTHCTQNNDCQILDDFRFVIDINNLCTHNEQNNEHQNHLHTIKHMQLNNWEKNKHWKVQI
jgi:hypothetical protein